MIFDLLLAEKYRVQQELAREGGEDIKQYLEYIHHQALAIQEQSGLSFYYAVPEGFVPPTIRPFTLETSPAEASTSVI